MPKRITTQRRPGMEGNMTDREAALRGAGIELHFSPDLGQATFAPDQGLSVAFSGYGEFTPITVRSETTIVDADMERN